MPRKRLLEAKADETMLGTRSWYATAAAKLDDASAAKRPEGWATPVVLAPPPIVDFSTQYYGRAARRHESDKKYDAGRRERKIAADQARAALEAENARLRDENAQLKARVAALEMASTDQARAGLEAVNAGLRGENEQLKVKLVAPEKPASAAFTPRSGTSFADFRISSPPSVDQMLPAVDGDSSISKAYGFRP